MAERPERYPVAVYRHLPRGWEHDPLPPLHAGPVYHYTGVAGLHGLIESGVAWASHVADLNDPSERRYGWDVIRERFEQAPPSASPDTAKQFAEIFDYVNEPGDWYPRAFVFSGSTLADSLTQYRLYGQCQVELAGATWTSVATTQQFDRSEGIAEWRPVLYGPTVAQPYVDRMLAAAAAIIESIGPEQAPEDEGLLAMLALEVLALHIKHPKYVDEREVRLVFSASPGSDRGAPRVRLAGQQRLVKYLEVTAVDESPAGFVKGVLLGPLAGGANTEEAIRLHHQNHFPDAWPRGVTGLPVASSETPFRSR